MAFNLVGYKVLLGYLQQRASVQMAEKLDSQVYNKASLTEVKVPLHLPYPTNDKDFERYDGSIEINGVTYNYVERKLQNDTLILHCVTNTTANNIKRAGNDYNKSINDLQPEQKGQKNTNTTQLLKSLECAGYRFSSYNDLNSVLYSIKCAYYNSMNEAIVNNKFSQSPEQPPDMA